MILKLLLLLAVFTHFMRAETGYICEQGYSGPQNSEVCFKLFSTPLSNFADARAICQKDGGDLASVHNAFEDAFVKTLGDAMLIGLQYSESANVFQWCDGTVLDYKNYGSDLVDNVDFLGYCVQHRSGKWENADCDTDLLKFLCKKPALSYTPTPNNVCPNASLYYTYGGTIYSPGYPNNYVKSLVCTYKLAARNGYVIQLRLDDLKLVFNYDYFLLFNHYDSNQYMLQLYPTEASGWEITVPTNRLSLEFHSQATGVWKLSWVELHESVINSIMPAPSIKAENYFCALGYTLSGDSCYRSITDKKLNYYDAVTYCRDDGADLTSIHDSYTDLYIQSLTRSTEALIGLTYIGSNAYQWSDGTPTDFDDYDSDFIPMREFLGYCTKVHGGKWLNAECNDKLGFICRKKATNFTPTPANVCPDASTVYKNSGTLFSPRYPLRYSGLGVCKYELMARKNYFIRIVLEEAEFPKESYFYGFYYSSANWIYSAAVAWRAEMRQTELIVPHNRYLLEFHPTGTGYWKISWTEVEKP